MMMTDKFENDGTSSRVPIDMSAGQSPHTQWIPNRQTWKVRSLVTAGKQMTATKSNRQKSRVSSFFAKPSSAMKRRHR
jgi:hypothetical protein